MPPPGSTGHFLLPRSTAAFLFLTYLPVFIHCASANRVGAFWMIRRVLVDGWRLEKAEEEANRVGLRSPHLRSFAHSYIERHRKQ